MQNPFSLEGKKVLITGASSGIGKAAAIECANMGSKLIICGRNQERLDSVLSQLDGDGHEYFNGDLTEVSIIESLVDRIDKIDGLVLSAGRGMTLPFQFATREKFDEIFNINFFAPVEILRLLVKKKKFNPSASVVFVCSIGGTEHFSVGNSIYGAAKAALQSMTRFCAIELAPKKIRVNSVNPGMVNTPLIKSGTISEEQLQKDMSEYPLKRYGEPEDIAHGIVYLLSEASSWVTGQSLIIDGGISI